MEPTQKKKKLWIIVPLVLILAVAAILGTPILKGIVKFNAGEYDIAAPLLKKYSFTMDKYLVSAEKLGDSCYAAGDYEEAITWYSELGENSVKPLNKVYLALGDEAFENGDCDMAIEWYEKMTEGAAEPLAKVYCAVAAGQLEEGLPADEVLATLSHITETDATVALRDETLLNGAALCLDRGSLADAIVLLDSVINADTAPIWSEINAIYINEAIALLASTDQTTSNQEPAAFVLMRDAQTALNGCRDSVMATILTKALDALFERDDKTFVSIMEQLASKAGDNPAAGEAAWALWRCFANLTSENNMFYYAYSAGYSDPYHILGNVLATGAIAAQLADPAEQGGSVIAAMAALAADGEVRHQEHPLCMDTYAFYLRLGQYGQKAGEQPKILFVRDFSSCSGNFAEYDMDYGIDMELMSLLPAEYWPTSKDDVTHIVSLRYAHNPHGKYQASGNSLFNITSVVWAVQETGCVRVYALPDGEIIYESETVTGPEPPENVTTSQKSGYISGGSVSLETQLKEALETCFPELDS